MATRPRTYDVFWTDRLVARVADAPGPLISRSAPPPRRGEGPRLCAFLSGTAYAPDHEGRLTDVLDRSHSLEEYLANLRNLGYRVVEQPS
jgi:hypothetical protein